MTRTYAFLWGLLFCLPACNRSDASATTNEARATEQASAASSPKEPLSGSPVAQCPEGRWLYDQSDQFLETLANSGNARVLSKKGQYVCTLSGREKGTMTCETSPGGVENVMEADAAVGKMVMNINMNGRSQADYEATGEGRWRVTSVDMTGFQLKMTVTLAGKEIALPETASMPGFDRAGSEVLYRCEGDKLLWKPEVAGVEATWATMTRLGS